MDKRKITKFFDNLAEEWDSGLSPDDEKMDEIMDAAGIQNGVRILDVACGTGVMFSYYLKRGASFIRGADISAKMLEEAERKWGNNEKIELLNADADSDYMGKDFDCVVVFNAFPHFPDPEQLLSNLKIALKDGGTLTVAHDWGRKVIDERHKGSASEASNGLMSETELAEIFNSLGFKNVYTKATEEIYIVSGKK